MPDRRDTFSRDHERDYWRAPDPWLEGALAEADQRIDVDDDPVNELED